MEDLPDICALDYLVGTLATAYKGSLQSLICRDFCIKQAPQGLVFTGRILALPSGNIQACLIQSGREIDRAPVTDDGRMTGSWWSDWAVLLKLRLLTPSTRLSRNMAAQIKNRSVYYLSVQIHCFCVCVCVPIF